MTELTSQQVRQPDQRLANQRQSNSYNFLPPMHLKRPSFPLFIPLEYSILLQKLGFGGAFCMPALPIPLQPVKTRVSASDKVYI